MIRTMAKSILRWIAWTVVLVILFYIATFLNSLLLDVSESLFPW